MKKLLLFLFMAFVVCHGLKAQNTGELNYFNLVLPDNSLVSYELADGIDIHFQDSIMAVNDLSFYIEEGVKYYFSEDEINAVDDSEEDNDSYTGETGGSSEAVGRGARGSGLPSPARQLFCRLIAVAIAKVERSSFELAVLVLRRKIQLFSAKNAENVNPSNSAEHKAPNPLPRIRSSGT